MFRKRVLLFLAPVLLAVLPVQATVLGSVHGIVHDPQHRPISGAEVVLRSSTSDWSMTTRTNEEGDFSFLAVPVGEYRVTVSSEGFSAMEQPLVVVSGNASVLHYQLQLAAARETVEVSERAEVVNPESASVTTLIERGRMERTPGPIAPTAWP